MSNAELQLSEDKYFFTFQDETQLWISRVFIERYPQFRFCDIIKHSDKYEDGSYYIDMPSLSMDNVIQFLMEDNVDISSLNLKDSYDIYEILFKYSVTLDNEKQSDLFFHVKELFYKYLKENNYDIDGYYYKDIDSRIPMELFNSERLSISIKGLFTPNRKDEFLYYSLLFKMMNITKVEIIYDYASNIPLEYICPSCIKDIFPSLKELTITVITHYKRIELLLNLTNDEFIKEYNNISGRYDDEIDDHEKCKYYTDSNMNEYNKIFSLDLNDVNNSYNYIDSYNEKRKKRELNIFSKYIINETIYTNENSKVEMNETANGYTSEDTVIIKYSDKINDKTFVIDKVSSKYGISQLLLLPSYLSISKNILIEHNYFQNDFVDFIKLVGKGVFDSVTTLSVDWIKQINNKFFDNQLKKILATHVFPNVIELIYKDDEEEDDNDKPFQLSSIKKQYFPKLHIINYKIEINIDNFESLFPVNIMSMIDTIYINIINNDQKEEIAILLDDLVYTHSIHIYIIDEYTHDCIYYFPHLKEFLENNLILFDCLSIDSSDIENIEMLDAMENYKQRLDCLYITFTYDEYDDDSDEEIDKKDSLERFLKSNVSQQLNNLSILFYKYINIQYLTWISTLFNDNKFNTIHKLTIGLDSIKEESSSEYLTIYESIMIKLIPKASIVNINHINDIPDDSFCKLYTKDNFPQLKTIKFYKYSYEWWNSFIEIFCTYINNDNFPSSSIVYLCDPYSEKIVYIYNPNNSIFRCKYDTNSYIDTIIGSEYETMNKFEIETLFDCINENKTQNIRCLEFCNNISRNKINIYNQQLEHSLFIHENHVDYKLV
ncbi:hypothetical protein WA158_003607 [Blastocystis sp. Blastoise]